MIIRCPICGNDKSITPKHIKRDSGKPCRKCSAAFNKGKPGHGSLKGDKAWSWKGGRIIHEGYVSIKIQPEDFFYPMASNIGYIKEHRLVMAKHLGRCLHSWEHIHHINGNAEDNRLKNLLLRDIKSHSKQYGIAYKEGYLQGYKDAKERRISQL